MNPHLFFKLLSDETRLRSVLLLVRKGELCVCELVEALGESQPKISRHLASLRSQGLLKDRRQGQWVYYSIAEDLPGWTKPLLTELGRAQSLSEQYQADSNRLQAMTYRPGRCIRESSIS